MNEEPVINKTSIQETMEKLKADWRERYGIVGEEQSRDLNLLVDAILVYTEERNLELMNQVVNERVASWALANSDEKIPLDKISKEGLAILLANPDYISNGELLEMLRVRWPDF